MDAAGRDRHKPPERVGPYRLEERLGRGGMGEVYRAFDERLGRRVAVKQILPEAAGSRKAWERLRREARTVASLNHPSIVQIFDVIEEKEGDWIVMELVEGTTLHRLIREGHLDLAQALQLAREIAEGLAEAHAKGVVHRDLKTENVMITEAGHAKILDFGLAKQIVWKGDDQSLSLKGAILGTGRAMSPEQAMGEEVDPRSDLFSLGSLFFELFTGHPPFRGSTFIYTLAQVCTYEPPPLAELNLQVPEELSALTAALLAKDPGERPESASEVVAVLSAILGSTVFALDGPGLFDSVNLEPLQRTSALSAEPRSGRGRLSRAPGSRATTAGIFVKTLLAVELLERETLLAGGKDALDILTKHERIAEDLLTRFESLVIRLEETLLLLFERPIEAVRYALAYLEALDELSVPGESPLRARAGIHLGEVFLRRSTPEEVLRGANPIEVEGRAELLTYQMMSLARPGEVLLSQGVFELAHRAVKAERTLDAGLTWETHGRYRFEGAGEEMQIFAVHGEGPAPQGPPPSTASAKYLGRVDEPAWRARRRFLGALLATAATAFGVWLFSRRAEEPLRSPSVVVWGFEDLSVDSSYDWVSIALMEALRSYLAAGPQAQVVTGEDAARARREILSVETGELSEEALERIRRSLAVDFVLTGSYVVVESARGGKIVSFVPRLQAVGSAEHALGSVTRELTDLAGLAARTGRDLRRVLGADEVSAKEEEELRTVLPSDLTATRFYCAGLRSLGKYDLFSARRQLERAIEHEPTFPLAHAALAEVLSIRGDDAAARKSLELAHAYSTSLPSELSLRLEAHLKSASGDWEEAVGKYRILFRFLPWNLDDGLALVRAQISAGAVDDAAVTVEQMRAWWKAGDGEDARLDLAAAEVAAAASDAKTQLEAARAAARTAQRQGATVLLGRARREEARALLALGRSQSAQDALAEAEELFRRTGERPELAEVLLEESRLEREKSEAQALLSEVRTIYRELGHVRAEWTIDQLAAR